MTLISSLPFTRPQSSGKAVKSLETVDSSSILSIAGSSQTAPLKEVWRARVCASPEEGVLGAVQSRAGGLYLLLADRVLLIDGKGETKSEYKVSQPYAVGEGKENVYITSQHKEESSCMYVSDRVERSLYAFRKNGDLVWKKEWPKDIYKADAQPMEPVEDGSGKLWIKACWKFFRFSANGQNMEEVNPGYMYPHPVFADQKGFAYTFYGESMRYSPDLTLKTIQGYPNFFFMCKDQPYTIAFGDRKMYRLDFDQEKKIEVLHWNEGKTPLKPFVAKDGMIHLVFNPWERSSRKGLYIVMTPDGHVVRRKELQVRGDDQISPLVTPDGTLYLLGEKTEQNRKTVYPVYALDTKNQFQVFSLAEEPIGMFQGKGEEVVFAFKSGTLLALETKSLGERLKEKQQEVRNTQALQGLENMQAKFFLS